MKFVFLNRDLLSASLVSDLRRSGHAVLVCSDAAEAELVLKLHGKTVNLVVAHDQAGLALISFMKASTRLNHLPVILTHSTWKDADFAKHRKGVEAAQAYLSYPCGDVELMKVFDSILGTSFAKSEPAARKSTEQKREGDLTSVSMSGSAVPIELEDAAAFYQGEGSKGTDLGGISIDLPLPKTEEAPAAGIGLSGGEPVLELNSTPGVESSGAGEASVQVAAIQPDDAGVVPVVPSGFGNGPAPGLQAHAIDGGITPEPTAALSPDQGIGLSIAPAEASAPETFDLNPAPAAPALLADPISPAEENLPEIPFEAPTMAKTIVQQASVQEVESGSIPTSPAGLTGQTSEVDPEALEQMPYLQGSSKLSPLAYTPPLDNAMVPGGAANAPDVETLKRYLLLREQDVLALSSQLHQAKDQLANLERQLRQERATNTEFAHLVQEQGRRIDHFEKEKEIAVESAQKEIDDLRFELKRRTDRAKLMEHQIREATQETEKLKERVRLDIRKIRSREKELENRLEIMKKDSEALLNAREQKIVELKRKLDLAEFNMDLLQDQIEKEKAQAGQLRAKLDRAAQVVRVAGGLLHPTEGGDGEMALDEEKDPAA